MVAFDSWLGRSSAAVSTTSRATPATHGQKRIQHESEIRYTKAQRITSIQTNGF